MTGKRIWWRARNRWAIAAAAALIASGCGAQTASEAPSSGSADASADSTPDQNIEGGSVSYRLLGEWGSFDVIDPTGTQDDLRIATAAYDRLVAIGPDGNVVPYLATEWEASSTDESTEVTFALTTEATCSDGTAVTPAVVEASLARLFDPDADVIDRRAFFGPGPWTVTSDEAAGTVTVTSETPYSDLVFGFASPRASIICPEGLEDPERLKTEIFGSGPFTLDSVEPGQSVTMQVRPDWAWGPEGTTADTPGFPQELVFRVIANTTTAANLLLTGELDIAYIVGSDVPRLREDGSLLEMHSTAFSSDWLMFVHTAERATSDEAVREAIVTAMDRNGWIQTMYQGEAEPATSFLTSVVPCFDPGTAEYFPEPSVESAREILTEAGWTFADGVLTKDGAPLAITILGHDAYTQAMEYMGDRFTQVGMDVTLDVVDRGLYSDRLRAHDWDVAPIFGTSPLPVLSYPTSRFSGPVPPEGNNFGQSMNPETESALAAAFAAATEEERCDFASAAQRSALERWDMMPLAEATYNWFTTGIEFHASALTPEFYSLRRVAPEADN